MDNQPDPAQRSLVKDVADTLEKGSKAVAAIVTAIGALATALGLQVVWLYRAGGAILLLGLAWIALGVYWRRTRAVVVPARSPARRSLTLIRGLFPLESSDDLLGRGREVDWLSVMVQGEGFRCGFLSGEAGAGKTSLLRAGLVPALGRADPPWTVIYSSRTGARPELLEHIKGPIRAVEGDLTAKLTAACGADQRVLLIFDQFEEFFLANRGNDRQPTVLAFEALFASLPKDRCRVLFALRKEFVDDLLSFFEALGETVTKRNRFALHNFPEKMALTILEEIATREQLPFAPALRTRVIADLARDERVRPVEFQLVLSRMLEQQIVNTRAYEARGGAWGIISSYIADETAGQDVPEAERRIARHILRSLCSEQFDARRPRGLTRAELVKRALPQPGDGGQAEGHGAASFERVVDRLLTAYLLIEEGDDRLNLTHDYLAPAIRDATGDIETLEEKANRLLERYAGRERSRERFVLLPPRALKDIRRHASVELKERTDARKVLRRSIGVYRGAGVATAVVALGTSVYLSLTQPTGWVTRRSPSLIIKGERQFSDDGRLAAILSKDRLTLVRLDAASLRAQAVSTPLEAVVVGPSGDEFLALGKRGELFSALGREDFHLKPVTKLDWRRMRSHQMWGGYSPDGTYRFATSLSGSVFLWPAGGEPEEIGRFTHFTDSNGNPLPSNTVPHAYTGSEDSDGSVPPGTVLISPGGHYLALGDGTELLIWRVSYGAGAKAPFLKEEVRLGFFDSDLAFAPDEAGVTWGKDGKIFWQDLTGNAPVRTLIELDRRTSDAQVDFSPSGKWMVMSVSFGAFYTWRVGSSSTSVAIVPPLPERRGGTGIGRQVSFDDAERLVAGLGHDKLAYVWPLGDLDPKPKPLLREVVDVEDDRFQQVTLCADGKRGLLRRTDGTLHRFDTLSRRLLEQVNLGRVGGRVHFRRVPKSDFIYIASETSLAFGNCSTGALDSVDFASSPWFSVTPNGRYLTVSAGGEFTRLERRFVVWGIPLPLLSRRWPLPASAVA